MTRVSTDTNATLQAQPPRSKPARDDAAPPRDGFSAMIDDPAPRPARGGSSDKTDRSQAANNHPDKARSDGDIPAKEFAKEPAKQSSKDDAAPPADDTATPPVVKPDAPEPDTIKADGGKTDASKTDAASLIASPPDPVAPAAPAAVVPPVAAIIVPQVAVASVAPQTPAPTGQTGPLSIAAAALAATAATVEAAKPQKPVGTLTPDPANADATTTAAEPSLTAAIGATTPAPKSAAKSATPKPDVTTADDASTAPATSDAAQPPAKPSATAKPDATPVAVKPDGATADTAGTPVLREHHAAAAQPAITDAAGQTFTPTQTITHSTTLTPQATPQMSVVASQTAPVPLGGLAMQIAASAVNGNTSFEIRLDPAELGRIDVRLDVDRHGNVTSHLTVEKPETLAMLRQDAPQLQRALNDAGLQTSDKGLQFSLSDQSLSGQNNNPQNNHDGNNGRAMQRLVIADDETLSLASAGRSYGRMLASSSGVDISI